VTRVCIIGAGCSGITTAKRLKEHEIDYDQFELSDDVGGNWYFRNPNGRSAVYESLHIDTSKTDCSSRTSRCRTSGRTSRTTR
jgi:cation diffusion facilitator CzcD-associated flavoprotein CzcO